MSETTTVVKALELLDGLEPDDIARKFEVMGVRGSEGLSTTCPVAKYLELLTERHYSVGKYALFDTDRDKNGYYKPSLDRFILNLPTNIRGFIAKFDNGAYPDLVISDDELGHPSEGTNYGP